MVNHFTRATLQFWQGRVATIRGKKLYSLRNRLHDTCTGMDGSLTHVPLNSLMVHLPNTKWGRSVWFEMFPINFRHIFPQVKSWQVFHQPGFEPGISCTKSKNSNQWTMLSFQKEGHPLISVHLYRACSLGIGFQVWPSVGLPSYYDVSVKIY